MRFNDFRTQFGHDDTEFSAEFDLSLTPAIMHNGASIAPAAGTARDFSNPVTYTVTAADGNAVEYTVSVNVAFVAPAMLTQSLPLWRCHW